MGGRGSRSVLRNPFTLAAAVLVTGAFVGVVIFIAFAPGVDQSLGGRLTGCLVLTACAHFGWRMAGHPAVVLTAGSLSVLQPFYEHSVPWRRLGSVNASDGLTLAVAGRPPIQAFAFSSSVLAHLSGDWSGERAARRIEAARLQTHSGPKDGAVDGRCSFGLLQLLVACFLAALVALCGWLADGRPG